MGSSLHALMGLVAVELVVIDWDGPASALSGRLGPLLALGIDVVLVPSPGATAAAAAVNGAVDRPGRLVLAPAGQADVRGWARARFSGPGAPEGAVLVVADVETLNGIL
ncbi:MAG: hypothetical protein ACR2KK_11640, partial [Acidimicrobiales bacterium]